MRARQVYYLKSFHPPFLYLRITKKRRKNKKNCLSKMWRTEIIFKSVGTNGTKGKVTKSSVNTWGKVACSNFVNTIIATD